MQNNVLFWFKNDLRLHDNEALCHAIASGKKVLPVFCVDPRLFENLELGFKKADNIRYEFLRQSVLNLRKNLKDIGGDLLIRTGIPEDIIPQLAREFHCDKIYAESEYAWEELNVIKAVEVAIRDTCTLELYWGKTLYHLNDIPYSIEEIPLTSKAYRINTTKTTAVREPLLTPHIIEIIEDFPASSFPECSLFGFKNEQLEPYVKGGETAALDRLQHYTFETEQLTNYRWTRNRSLGMEYSSKFSPYLALGCLSPRVIYQKVKQYELLVKKNQSTWWIIFELVWRDFFTFKGMRMGNAIFKTEGYRNKEIDWDNDPQLFQRWCEGRTGIPFIDAHMRQLNATGYMSNRGRVNCSSFLVHDYKIDWTWGAAYFESKLIDYDVSANWMNWHVQAYEIWYTNPVNQALKYKAKEFIQKWIKELESIDDARIYAPWEYQLNELSGYPTPVEVFKKWSRAINLIKKDFELN